MSFIKKMFAGSELADDEGVRNDNSEAVMQVADKEEDSQEGQLALDAFADKDNVYIKSTIAGVKPEDLDITIAADQITIQGERRQEEEVSAGDYFYQECYWGSFSRTLPLPVEIDVDKAQADLKDGILTLVLPKASRARTKKVKIRQQEV